MTQVGAEAEPIVQLEVEPEEPVLPSPIAIVHRHKKTSPSHNRAALESKLSLCDYLWIVVIIGGGIGMVVALGLLFLHNRNQ